MEYKANEIVLNKADIEKYKNILNGIIVREIVYETQHDMIVFVNGEICVVNDDTVRWLKANSLIDLIALQYYMERMSLGDNDREGITAYILELYDKYMNK